MSTPEVTSDRSKASSPVERIPGDESDKVEMGVALCLSGGGYRAMVFHLGALWRLNELGHLGRIARFSSVSGGSITSATLGLNWQKLGFDKLGVAQNLEGAVITPIRNLASSTIDVGAILGGLILGGVAKRVPDAYRKHQIGRAHV